MLILNQEWASEYGQRGASPEFRVLGGGSGRGIAALLSGDPDVAAASRKMKEPERAAFEEQHGFDLAVELVDDNVAASEQKTMISLRFAPAGGSIRRIRALSVHIGVDIAIPLTLDEDLSGRFALRRPLIARTSVHLAEAGAPHDGHVYIVPLGSFCAAE